MWCHLWTSKISSCSKFVVQIEVNQTTLKVTSGQLKFLCAIPQKGSTLGGCCNGEMTFGAIWIEFFKDEAKTQLEYSSDSLIFSKRSSNYWLQCKASH